MQVLCLTVENGTWFSLANDSCFGVQWGIEERKKEKKNTTTTDSSFRHKKMKKKEENKIKKKKKKSNRAEGRKVYNNIIIRV